jgi:hypothetical protein
LIGDGSLNVEVVAKTAKPTRQPKAVNKVFTRHFCGRFAMPSCTKQSFQIGDLMSRLRTHELKNFSGEIASKVDWKPSLKVASQTVSKAL